MVPLLHVQHLQLCLSATSAASFPCVCQEERSAGWIGCCYGVVECCPPLPSLASAFDSAGRPLEAAFYTGSPAYHNVVYEIYCQHSFLEVAMEKEEGWLREEVKAVPTQWVKKASLSNIIAEELSDRQVSIKTVGIQS